MKWFMFELWVFKMVRISISLSSAFPSLQCKSVSCMYWDDWPVFSRVCELHQSTEPQLKLPLLAFTSSALWKSGTFTWGGVQVLSFVQWEDTTVSCSLKGSVVMAAVRLGRTVHQEPTLTPSPQVIPSTVASLKQFTFVAYDPNP